MRKTARERERRRGQEGKGVRGGWGD